MCTSAESRPPIGPLAGAAVEHRRRVLRAADGATFTAFEARADHPSGAGILVLPDVRGLHAFYEELALRFAEAGIDALAIDYFGRTAGTDPRAEDFDFAAHVAETAWQTLSEDVAAGAAALREGGRVQALFSVGFCFGGRLSFLAATLDMVAADGVIGFYGVPVGAGRAGLPAPAEVTDRIGCPVLAIFGGADPAIPPESIETFRSALRSAGVEHEVQVYPGAPHSFFDRKADQFASESADAWERVLTFVRAHAAASKERSTTG
jgi:carboxymethylenebutenolidase